MAKYRMDPPYYPIVYVRGFTATAGGALETTFHDAYYGFSDTSVEKRQAPAPDYFVADVFEGQLIRFMKEGTRNRDGSVIGTGYVDASNEGLHLCSTHEKLNPARSIWICRFYDRDFMLEKVRPIEDHARDLWKLVSETIPEQLERCGVDLGENRKDYKVILIAHSMGGLVCRTLLQNIMPEAQQEPARWVHRLVTIATPHRGVDLGNIPDFMEKLVGSAFNPFDVSMFQEDRMRKYLKLGPGDDLGSLKEHFPVENCLCLIGTDYQSYSIVQKVTGSFSDGLVRQDRAYIPGAFYANVHRAHSGFRGIVNSYESYENIRRYLFGDTRVEITLEEPTANTPLDANCHYYYDFEFLLTIRNARAYLHRREQRPCENAIRLDRDKIPERIPLHTAFLDSKLRDPKQPYSHFALTLRVIEHRAEKGFMGLWDHEYPSRPIYVETVELRIGDPDDQNPGARVEYRWLSETKDWQTVSFKAGAYTLPLRASGAFQGSLRLKPFAW